MDNLIGIFIAVLPPFLLLGVGAFARSVGWLRAEADASLSMVTIRILYPCFILFHILENGDTRIEGATFLMIAIGFASILTGFFLAWVVSKVLRLEEESVRTFRFCAGIFNYGFIAIPVALAFFDSNIVVHIILFNLGVEIAIWTIGILILTANKLSLKGLLNPPAIAVIVGLALQTTGGKQLIPSFFWEVVEILGQCSIPIGLLLIGGSFYQLMDNFRFSNGLRTEIASLLVRNLFFPCLVISFIASNFCPTDIPFLREVLVIQAAMPAGIFAVVIVSNYSANSVTAMRTISVTMLVSLLTLPIWLSIGFAVL
ncbi:MAG: AEC family transporter [Opitutales bacterium]